MGANKYKSSSSTTFVKNEAEFSYQYGSGTVSGFYSQDVFGLGDLKVTKQVFGEATQESSEDFGEEIDGILGLGYPEIAVDDVTPVFDNMIAQGLVSKNIFSVYLSRENSTKSTESQIVFGGIDRAHYTGLITYVPVSEKAYWQFKMDR